MANGWQRDGSGLRVYRCRGKTYCPRSTDGRYVRQNEPDAWAIKCAKSGKRRGYRFDSETGGKPFKALTQGPADHAKKNMGNRWHYKGRKGLRRYMAKRGVIKTNPMWQDTRYHLRKSFEGRKATK